MGSLASLVLALLGEVAAEDGVASPAWATATCLLLGGVAIAAALGRGAVRGAGARARVGVPDVVEPEHLLCPITHAMMRDPVFVVDSGNTYERDAVLGYWDRLGEARDPLTNTRLPSREVWTNWDTRRNVQAFLDQHPTFSPDGWDGSRELHPPDRPPPAPPAPEAPPAEDVGEDGLAASVRAHCAAVAEAHGGRLPEELLGHLAGVFGVPPQRLRDAFPEAPEAGPEAPEARAPEARAPLSDAARAHCEAVAQAHGGALPEALMPQLAQAFGVDEAALRAAFAA